MSAIGRGDMVLCIASASDEIGDALVEGRVYQIEAFVPVTGGCRFCASRGHDDGIRTTEDRGGGDGWCPNRFRPAGRGGMFADLLTAKPVRVGEPA